MGMIHIDLFSTLDGVAQAPGGPEEDPEGGFPFGGWQAQLYDDVVGREVREHLQGLDALLLGRRTYDIFAAYWPFQEDGGAADIARPFNAVPKYVASRGSPTLEWANSHLLGPDLPAELDALRERHEQIHVIGSINLVQTLLGAGLFDRLTLWVYPIVLGTGKKVFPDGASPASFSLAQPPMAGTTGAVLLRYDRGLGPPQTGDMTREEVGTQ